MNWLHPLSVFNYVRDQAFPDPAKKAMGPLNEIPGTIKPYYNPYIEAGGRALPQLESQYTQLLSDPNAIISRLGAGYTQSPGYKYKLGQGEQEIGNAYAAGGLLGTPGHQQEAGRLAENLASEDYDKYLQNAEGLYGMGLTGEQGLATGGYTAGSSLAEQLAQVLSGKSGLQYAGQANRNAMTGNLINGIIAALVKGGASGAG
jgi:hypothetical protein